MKRKTKLGAALMAAASLSACERSLKVDLAVSGVDGVDRAVLPVSGVRVLDEDDEVHTLSLGDTFAPELPGHELDYLKRLLSDESVAEGTYQGLSLHFDEDAGQVWPSGEDAVTVVFSGSDSFRDMDVTLDSNGSAHLVVILDLRFSLSDRRDSLGAYYVDPYFRVVNADSAGTLAGTVDADFVESNDCRQGRKTGVGVAVYGYAGTDVEPQDFVNSYTGASVPIASSPVIWDAAASAYRYSIAYLEPGSYTVALTCEGDQEDPLIYQGLSFAATAAAQISTGEESWVALP